jgi:predicted transcriptional regulator
LCSLPYILTIWHYKPYGEAVLLLDFKATQGDYLIQMVLWQLPVGPMKKIYVEVMTSDQALKRLTRAWRKAAAGENAEPTIGVGSIGELSALLSPKRMELLRHVAEHPGLSVRALSQALSRDYKNVHTDVSDLESSHLLSRDNDGRLNAPYDEIVIRAPLRKVA